MARICIVTSSALGSNPRVVKEAEALTAAGHAVHVIAVRVLDLVDARDADVLAGARWSCERIDLRSRLKWRLLRLAQKLSGAFSPVTAPLARRAAAWPADLYIAHYPAALPAVAKAAAKHGALYGFDAEDFHTGDPPPGAEHEAERAAIGAVEAAHLPHCAFITAASPGIAQAYAKAYGVEPPAVILNVFAKADAPAMAAATGSASPRPSLYWFSQTIGPDRGLEAAVDALALSRARPHLYLRGNPAAGFVATLNRRAESLGVADRLHWLDSAPPSQMVALAADHDLGLVAETGHSANRAIALTNKQFTYLLAGVPAVLSDIPAHRAFAEGAVGAAFIYRTDDAADLARVLDQLLLDPTALPAARRRAFELGQDRFNWDREKETLVSIVSRALERAPR